MAVAVAQVCLEEALPHARERNQYLKAAWLKDQNLPHTFEATAAKLFASEMLEKTASDALQIHGGYGYMDEYPIPRYYKGAKILQIVEGTSEVLRMIIGRLLFKKSL